MARTKNSYTGNQNGVGYQASSAHRVGQTTKRGRLSGARATSTSNGKLVSRSKQYYNIRKAYQYGENGEKLYNVG